MKHHSLGLAPGLVSHLQRLTDQLAVRRCRHGPSHHPAGKQVEYHRQVDPATSRPNVSYIATPHLIGLGYRKLPVEAMGDVRLLQLAGVPMPSGGLLAFYLQLSHQPPRLVASDLLTLLFKGVREGAGTCRPSTCLMQDMHL